MAYDATKPPEPTGWLLRGFLKYVDWYMGRSFDGVRVLKGHEPADVRDNGRGLIVILNHPSWWDPLACAVTVKRCAAFAGRTHHAPIEADMLEHYGVFKKLGFYGVQRDDGHTSPREAQRFVKLTQTIAADPQRAVWVTVQGTFVDPRVRPVELRPGVAHVCRRLARDGTPADVLPMAIEYPFWDVKKPELLLAFGVPVAVEGHADRGVEAWNATLGDALTATMDALADAAVSRDAARFVKL